MELLGKRQPRDSHWHQRASARSSSHRASSALGA
jgi:hypothetical protein